MEQCYASDQQALHVVLYFGETSLISQAGNKMGRLGRVNSFIHDASKLKFHGVLAEAI